MLSWTNALRTHYRWIYDSFASYAWLFIDAFSLGLGAFLAALAFTRLPRRQMVDAAASAFRAVGLLRHCRRHLRAAQ
jgi:hypothetical protein